MNRPKLKKLAALLITLPSLCIAETRYSADPIFAEPPTAGTTQVILGLTDAALAALLWPKTSVPKDPRLLALQVAETEMATARAMITEAEKTSQKLALETANRLAAPGSVEALAGEKALASLLSRTTVSEAARTAALENASRAMTEVRGALLNGANAIKGEGIVTRGMKGIRMAGSALFIMDIASRIYVWNAMDRNPTLTPVGSYLHKEGSKLFNVLDQKGWLTPEGLLKGAAKYQETFEGTK